MDLTGMMMAHRQSSLTQLALQLVASAGGTFDGARYRKLYSNRMACAPCSLVHAEHHRGVWLWSAHHGQPQGRWGVPCKPCCLGRTNNPRRLGCCIWQPRWCGRHSAHSSRRPAHLLYIISSSTHARQISHKRMAASLAGLAPRRPEQETKCREVQQHPFLPDTS